MPPKKGKAADRGRQEDNFGDIFFEHQQFASYAPAGHLLGQGPLIMGNAGGAGGFTIEDERAMIQRALNEVASQHCLNARK